MIGNLIMDMSGIHKVLKDCRKKALLKMMKSDGAEYLGNGKYKKKITNRTEIIVDVNKGIITI